MKALNIEVQRRSRVTLLRKRSGFTLIELMTVIAIMGMLGAISITTVRSAVQSAKETQTRNTIAKIDNVLTGLYEKYQYRRLEVMNGTTIYRAKERVYRMRDLLRRDFPCTFEEVNDKLLDLTSVGVKNEQYYTPLQEVYLYELKKNGDLDDPKRNVNAELLYLVIMNGDPESRAAFSEREIGDTDGNGHYVFIDGWGNPIEWMRWAPGLKSSDRQPEVVGNGTFSEPEYSGDDADPFDPMDIVGNAGQDELPGWYLVPYVYSMGPDGMNGLKTPSDLTSDQIKIFMRDPFNFTRNYTKETPGIPVSLEYKDNIDNHTLVR